MRNYCRLTLFFISISITMSCVNGSMQGESSYNETDHFSSEYLKRTADSKSEADRLPGLSDMQPKSQASLKAWLPEQIDNYKRTYYSTGELAVAGVASLKSIFKNQDEPHKEVQVEIMDGARSGVAAMFISGLQRSLDAEIEEQSDEGYRKAVEKNGLKAMEEQNYKYKSASLQFIESNRFHVKLAGKNISADELWRIAGKLNTDKLVQL